MNDIWQHHDSKMIELRKIYDNINKYTKNKLQEYFNRFQITSDNLYSIVSQSIKNEVNLYIEEWKLKGYLKGYFGSFASSIYLKTRITYADILELLIYEAYIEQEEKESREEYLLFFSLLNYYYIQGQNEVNDTLDNKKKVKSLDNDLFLTIMMMPNALGYTYNNYKETITKYNAEQITRQAIISVQQNKKLDIHSVEFDLIIKKQQNAKININGDKISGSIDTTLIGMNNRAKVEGITAVDEDAQVVFLSVEDEKRTKMCKSLHGKIFNVKGWNEFTRYSDSQRSIKKYRCKGLVVGLNLPPINDHFHYCRSIIYYLHYAEKHDIIDENLEIPKIKNAEVLNVIDSAVNEKIVRIFNKYLTKDDFKIDNNYHIPFSYNIDSDKIIMNPQHRDIKMYDITQSLLHEIMHKISIENKLLDKDIINKIRRLKLSVSTNIDYYKDIFSDYKYYKNMTLGNNISLLSENKVDTLFYHKNGYVDFEEEILANIETAYLIDDKLALNFYDNIDEFKELKESVIKKYGF